MDDPTWMELPRSAPGLPAARLVVHHLAQLVAAPGQALLPVAPDDGQQALTLARGLLLGAPVAGGTLRAGLDPRALALHLCDGAGAPLATLPLAGRTLADGLRFLEAELGRRGHGAALALPSHPEDFPAHPLARGAAAEPGVAADRALLAGLLEATDALLRELGGPGATPRLWPHHFDLAVTIRTSGRRVGLGVSPGDGAAGRPSWYATPWPMPPRLVLPPLAGGGQWRAEGWASAELPLEALEPGAARQRAQVAAFLRSALALPPLPAGREPDDGRAAGA